MLSLTRSSVPAADSVRIRPALSSANRAPRAEGRLVVAAGAAAMLVGILANERLLGFLFAPDGAITGGAQLWIRLLEWFLIVGGAGLIRFRPRFEFHALRSLRLRPDTAASALGILGVLFVAAIVELGFHAYNTISARQRPKEVVRYSAPLWQPGVVCHSRKTIGDRELYEVTYRRDAAGARITPDSAGVDAGRDLVFFGGSFTFGQGVEDGETLPNRVARLAPGWQVTNFGYPGHGPAQMLDRLQQPHGLRGLTGRRTIVVDVFIPDHVRRTIGSMRVAATWGRHFPYYTFNAEGGLDRRGTFADGRPALSRVYEWLAREPVMKCFNVDLPLDLIEGDLALVARVDAEAKSIIRRANHSAEFVVVLFPDRPGVEFSAAELIPHLEAAGLRYLDYSPRLQGDDGMWIPGDGHPTPAAYATVARWLADDLSLVPSSYHTD